MTEKVLPSYKGLYLPRKSFDTTTKEGNNPILEARLEQVTRGQYADIGTRYGSDAAVSDDMDAADRFWAREMSAFLISGKDKYGDFIPGRFLTYRSIADKIESYKDAKGSDIAELGCGSGICLTLLAEDGANVYGIDQSMGAVAYFEYLSKDHFAIKEKFVHAQQGDFFETNYADGQFDAVFNVGVFEHMRPENQARLLKEMKRITKDDGIIMVSVPNESSPLYRTTREREKGFFEKIKADASDLVSCIFPWISRQHGANTDLEQLYQASGLDVLEYSATLLAPSGPMKVKNLSKDEIEFFKRMDGMTARGTNLSDKMKNLMQYWKNMEMAATQEELMKYGWFKYIIGRKTKAGSEAGTETEAFDITKMNLDLEQKKT
jgi:SAM-dependent methyltransferase